MARDTYAEVTGSIVAQLERGVRPWEPRWQGSPLGLPKRVTGETYRGINIPILWSAACAKGYASPTWMTYRQAGALGAQVRKGERATTIVFATTITREGEDAEEKRIPVLRAYAVFNADQIDGLPDRFLAAPAPALLDDSQRIQAADAIIASTGARIVHGGSNAYYQPSADLIRLPEFGAFRDAEAYYATALHELGHWTGAEKRLNRTFGKRFGDSAYAMEELVAEMCAAFACASIGISAEPREDHASYLASWIAVLKSDKRAIFAAATAAQRACDFILGTLVPAAEAA